MGQQVITFSESKKL